MRRSFLYIHDFILAVFLHLKCIDVTATPATAELAALGRELMWMSKHFKRHLFETFHLESSKQSFIDIELIVYIHVESNKTVVYSHTKKKHHPKRIHTRTQFLIFGIVYTLNFFHHRNCISTNEKTNKIKINDKQFQLFKYGKQWHIRLRLASTTTITTTTEIYHKQKDIYDKIAHVYHFDLYYYYLPFLLWKLHYIHTKQINIHHQK